MQTIEIAQVFGGIVENTGEALFFLYLLGVTINYAGVAVFSVVVKLLQPRKLR